MMRRTMKRMVVGVFAAALALPAALRAETPVIGGEPDLERARALKAQAEALYDQPKEWRKAAQLLEGSASLRPADDPEAYTCLLQAARIRGTLGDVKAAKRLFEKAAQHALARGMVLDAAQAYADGVFAAYRDGDMAMAADLSNRARLLAHSPAIGDQDRNWLLSRLD